MAMTATLKGWIEAPSSGGVAQFVLPGLFRACLDEVEERHNFIKSILFPPEASTTSATTAMRDHIIEHHKTLFHLTPVESQDRVIESILRRVDKCLSLCFIPEHEVTRVVWHSNLHKVAVAYVGVVVRVLIQDPEVCFHLAECDTVLGLSKVGLTKISGAYVTADGVEVSKFIPDVHSSELVVSDSRQGQLYIVVFPAVLVDRATRVTKSYTVGYKAKQELLHELGANNGECDQ